LNLLSWEDNLVLCCSSFLKNGLQCTLWREQENVIFSLVSMTSRHVSSGVGPQSRPSSSPPPASVSLPGVSVEKIDLRCLVGV
jgi:hypothetical protein